MFCSDKIYSESREVWRNIVDSDEIVRDCLEKRRTSSVAAKLLFNSMIVMHLEKTAVPIHSVLLLISSTKNLVTSSLDPSENFEVILNHCSTIASNANASNIALFVLAEILQITSIVHIPKLVRILDSLIREHKLGHPSIRLMILDGLIQVLAYPSFSTGKLKLVEQLLNFIQTSSDDQVQSKTSTSSFQSHFVDISADLTNARDVSTMLEESNQLSLTIFKTEADKIFWTRNQLVLRGLLQSKTLAFESWLVVLKNLIEISKTDETMKSSLVMPLLFKLSSSSDPRTKLAILQNIVQLGATPEVFGTIKALSNDMLRSVSIDLFLRLWKVEPRIYPFLHKALVEKNSKDADDQGLEIVRAAAIKEVCEIRPQHGSDLVSTISEILNSSTDLRDGDIQASLAIKAITLLCQNHVINVVSTWKAISFTTRYEKRPRVITSLCKFFEIVPTLKRTNLEYENFNKEILARLWSMIQFGDQHAIKCASKALRSWNYETMTMDTIPEVYREGIALPEVPLGMEVSILDLEVSGESFVQLLTKVNPSGRFFIGELLKHYIGCEITDFRSGHYLIKEGQPEPLNYKTLPKTSILKALISFVIQQGTSKKADKLVEEAILVEALRILSQRYVRPLPPLNWCFLYDMLFKSDDIKAGCLLIAAKQSVISGTAKRLIENFLVNVQANDDDDIQIALDALPDLCNGISPDVMKSFCEFLFKTKHEGITESVKKCLEEEKVITNRDNFAMLLSMFVNSSFFKPEIIKLIPPKLLDPICAKLSLPQKFEFRCEVLKVNANVENPVSWINEIITEQLISEDNEENFFKSFIDLLLDSDVFPKKKFINDFVIMMQNRLVDLHLESHKIKFLLKVFSISLITVSGYFKIFKSRDELSEKFIQILPQSIQLVSQQTAYDEVIGKIFEFILHIIDRDEVDDDFKSAFKLSVVSSKNHVYFKKSKVWQKFLLLR